MIDADIRIDGGDWPPEEALEALVNRCVEVVVAEAEGIPDGSEVAILFSDDAAQRILNRSYRDKDSATNVLSFPAGDAPVHPGAPRFLGDISLAHETMTREAEAGAIAFDAHLHHLIIHGLLHLLGYDHGDDAEASLMERTETRALARLGIADPYGSERVQDL